MYSGYVPTTPLLFFRKFREYNIFIIFYAYDYMSIDI